MSSFSAQTMYDDTELPSREQDPSIGNWCPLPHKPSKGDGNSDEYEVFGEQDVYGSISLSCAKEELKAEAQPPDPDIETATAQSTFIPVQWKDCWGKNGMAVLLVLAAGCLLLDIVLLSQYAAVFSELRKLNITSAAQESFDPSTVSLTIHELKSALITELRSLENHINNRSEATNKNVKEQISQLEEKMKTSLQDLKGTVCSRCALLNWQEFEGQHYYFSEMAQPWENAKEFCAAANSYLLVISNSQEQDFVISQIRESVWLGLSDITTEGIWSWVDGSPVRKTYWRRGEPNNIGDEDCVALYKEKKWNDIPCDTKVMFVCEKK